MPLKGRVIVVSCLVGLGIRRVLATVPFDPEAPLSVGIRVNPAMIDPIAVTIRRAVISPIMTQKLWSWFTCPRCAWGAAIGARTEIVELPLGARRPIPLRCNKSAPYQSSCAGMKS
jgi:hypothetical protein